MADSLSLTPGALLETLTRRIERISEEQHSLHAERNALEDQARLLRLGITTPEAVLIGLHGRGIRLRGVAIRTETTARGHTVRCAPGAKD